MEPYHRYYCLVLSLTITLVRAFEKGYPSRLKIHLVQLADISSQDLHQPFVSHFPFRAPNSPPLMMLYPNNAVNQHLHCNYTINITISLITKADRKQNENEKIMKEEKTKQGLGTNKRIFLRAELLKTGNGHHIERLPFRLSPLIGSPSAQFIVNMIDAYRSKYSI